MISPFNPALDAFALPNGMSVANGGAAALAYLNKLATTQAQMISYLDDFKMMAIVTLACVPMLLLLRKRSARRPVRQRRPLLRRRASSVGGGKRRNRKGAVWTSQPTPPYQPWSCGFTPFGTPPHRLGLNLSASALKSQVLARPRIGQAIERFGRRSWSIGSPGTTRASLRHLILTR